MVRLAGPQLFISCRSQVGGARTTEAGGGVAVGVGGSVGVGEDSGTRGVTVGGSVAVGWRVTWTRGLGKVVGKGSIGCAQPRR